jgi:hypothetical protein
MELRGKAHNNKKSQLSHSKIFTPACDVKNLHKRHVKNIFFFHSHYKSSSCIAFAVNVKCLFKYFQSMNDSFALAENALRAPLNFNNNNNNIAKLTSNKELLEAYSCIEDYCRVSLSLMKLCACLDVFEINALK